MVGGTWRTVDTSRLQYFKMNGAWTPIMQLWVKGSPPSLTDHAWHREPGIATRMSAVQNLNVIRYNGDNHSSVTMGWDCVGNLEPGDFVPILADENDNWLSAPRIGAGSREYTFSGLSQNTKYKLYLYARYPGGEGTKSLPDDVYGPLKWYNGLDAQPQYYDILGWGGDFYWRPGVNVTSTQNGYPASSIWDTDDNTAWVSANVPEAFGTSQGEGIEAFWPGAGYRITSLVVRNLQGHDIWYGVYHNGAWEGGSYPYNGKYQYWRHYYLNGISDTTYTEVGVGPYETSIANDGAVHILQNRSKNFPGLGQRITCANFMIRLQTYGKVGTGVNYTAPIPSYWWT